MLSRLVITFLPKTPNFRENLKETFLYTDVSFKVNRVGSPPKLFIRDFVVSKRMYLHPK